MATESDSVAGGPAGSTASTAPAQPGGLRRNALSVVGAVAMAMAFMGPATSAAFNTQPAAGGAGYALPFAIILALVACLLVANTIAAFARKLPTAGFVYTFNTRGLGRDGGFMSGWLLLLAYGMIGPMLFAAIGSFASDFIATQFHVHIAWEFITLAFVLIVWGINATGVSRSAKTALIFLVLEVGVILSLFATILAKGGAQGVSLGPLDPMHSLKGLSGLGTGMLWGILMFIGFESAGTLGEEARSPRRTVPIALFTGVGVIGVFYVFSGYATAIGFGHSHVGALVADSNPFLTLASRYWGLTWLVALTVLNSQFANLLSGSNAFVRVLFAMGREGILPRVLARTDRSYVPQVALAGYMLFSLAYALGAGSQIGPLGVYGFAGTILGLDMVICYILMSVAVIRFYRKDYRPEFSVVRHGVFPVAGALLMLLPIYGLIWPVPAYPSNLVPWITLGWLAVGAVYLWVIHRRRQDLLTAMGRVFEEEPGGAATGAPLPGAAPSGSA
jgi:amino acid transporter